MATRIHRRAPGAALRPFVSQILVVEAVAAREDTHLPQPGLVAAFRLRGDCRLDDGTHAPDAALSGLFDQVRGHAHAAGHAVALVAFTPVGAAAFVRQPLDALANRTCALDELLEDRAALSALQDRLWHAADAAQAASRLEHFLLGRLAAVQPDPLVAAAVAWLERAAPGSRIDALVRHIGLSQSALERRFRRAVGTTPKRFASLLRLQRVVALMRSGAPLTAIAHAAGYFDQAHFIHDFRRMTGQAPGRADFLQATPQPAP